MAQELKLKVTDEPTYFNKEMAIGTLLVPVIGTIIGGYLGKRRMEKEKAEGRTTSDEASAWNKDTLLGAAIGRVAGAILGAGLGLITTVALGPVAGLAVHIASEIAGIAIGGSIGSKEGIRRQDSDFVQAQHQQSEAAIGNAMNRSPEREPSQGKGREFAPAIESERGAGMQPGR